MQKHFFILLACKTGGGGGILEIGAPQINCYDCKISVTDPNPSADRYRTTHARFDIGSLRWVWDRDYVSGQVHEVLCYVIWRKQVRESYCSIGLE